MTFGRQNALRSRFLRSSGRKKFKGKLGDGVNLIYVPGRKGYVYVREELAVDSDGNFVYSEPFPVRDGGGSSYGIWMGAGVRVAWDEIDSEYFIERADFQSTIADGVNPSAYNPSNPYIKADNPLKRVPYLLSQAVATGGTPTTKVSVNPFAYIDGAGVFHAFAGDKIDLNGDIPSSGQHRLSVVWLKEDETLDTSTSTAKSITIPLTFTADLAECLNAPPSSLSIPTKAYRLYGDQTTVTQLDEWDDIRQWINVPSASTLTDALIKAPDSTTRNTAQPTDPSYPALTAKAHASQSTNIFQVTDSSDNVLFAVNETGAPVIGKNTNALTISSGAITVLQGYHVVTSESSTSDDLDTINGGAAGDLLVLQAASSHTIRLRSSNLSGGNIIFNDGPSQSIIVPITGEQLILLQYNGSNWVALSYNKVNRLDFGEATEVGTLGTLNGGFGANVFTGDEGQIPMRVASNGVFGTVSFPAPLRNLIIGSTQYWPTGTSFSSPSTLTYTCVNAKTNYSLNGGSFSPTHAITQQAFTLGQTDVPHQPRYFLRWAGNISGGGGSEFLSLNIPIEDVRATANGDITISFWLKGSAGGTIAVQPVQVFGTGGSPSSSVFVTAQEITLTTSWVRYHLTFSMPNINGKTIGTNDDSFMSIFIYKQAGATFASTNNLPGAINYTGTLDMVQEQCERGAIMTAYEQRSVTEERKLMERYFYRRTAIQAFGTFAALADVGTTASRGVLPHPRMRVAPTVSYSGVGDFALIPTASTFTSLTFERFTDYSVEIAANGTGMSAGTARNVRDAGSGVAWIQLDARI